jgi:hypothetical protein
MERGAAVWLALVALAFLVLTCSAGRVFLEESSGPNVVSSSSASALNLGRPIRPKAWTMGSRLEANAPIKLTLAIKQRNLEKLDAIFWDVSNPKSPRYGDYLSAYEVDALVAPEQEHVRKVEEWLVENGVASENIERPVSDFLVARTDAATAERLLRKLPP